MITRVNLKNWTSFGAPQTAPLEAITVIVGANNSGKSNFLKFPQVISQPVHPAAHRPPFGDGKIEVGWETNVSAASGGEKTYPASWTFVANVGEELTSVETINLDGAKVYEGRTTNEGFFGRVGNSQLSLAVGSGPVYAHRLSRAFRVPANIQRASEQLMAPVVGARLIHLKMDNIRLNNVIEPKVTVATDGSFTSATIASWAFEFPEKLDEFNDIFCRCLPEMKRVLARCHQSGAVQMVFEQRDGERFLATDVSDGVVVFAALIAHAVEAPKNGLVLIEEPERGIHPRAPSMMTSP